MNRLIFTAILLLPLNLSADTITLKDGTRLEGVVESEKDGVAAIKTQYGILNISRSDIVSQVKPVPPAAPAPAPAPAAAEPVTVSTKAAEPPAASTETAVLVSTAPPELPAAPAGPAVYTIKTVTLSTSAYEKNYYENGVQIATEFFDGKNNLLGVRGDIKDATYKEYYENGVIRSEKTILRGKLADSQRAYFPDGRLQSEAEYLDGTLNGSVRVYNENGKPVLEQNFKSGVPNGWFREFGPDGSPRSERYYIDGRLADKPSSAVEVSTAPAEAETPESVVTAVSRHLARGERILFHLNGKYVAKMQLDNEFNVIARDGKLPDGAVKIFGKAGDLEKVLTFRNNELIGLKVYGAGGSAAGEFTYKEGRAVKK